MVDLPQYPGYGIEPDGRVWSYKTNKYLKQRQDKNTGYYMVWMSINGKPKAETVHRLIALAYIPNPENKKYIDHIDRDRTNNSIENLRWVSATENFHNSSKYKGNDRKANCKRYYEKHREEIRRKAKEKYDENPEKFLSRCHKYYDKIKDTPEHKEKQKERNRKYHEKSRRNYGI